MDILLFIIAGLLFLNLAILLFRRVPDGEMVIEELPDGRKTFALNLEGDPEDLPSKKVIVFKVVNKL